MNLHGVLAPVVTTFAPDGEVDAAGFASNIGAHLAAGLCGIVVTGSTGEAALLDDSERNKLVETARRVVPSDRTLLVGTGAESTRAAIARTKAAAERGADGVLVVAPHYYANAMTSEALLEHYERVADSSPVPVLLYTIPKYMHFALPADVVSRLAGHENIVGMKDSSGDATLFNGYLESQSDTFRVLTGSGVFFADALSMGAYGAILAVSLFAPQRSLDVFHLHASGSVSDARAAQTALTPVAGQIVSTLGIAGVKAALDHVGLTGGIPRPPLRPLTAAAQLVVEQLLATAESAVAA